MDPDKLQEGMQGIEARSYTLKVAQQRLVQSFTADLDRFIDEMRGALRQGARMTDGELEALVLNIPAHVYFVSEGLEKLALDAEVAVARRKEQQYAIFTDQSGGVEARRQAADVGTLSEQFVAAVYDHAYKEMKMKLDIAQTLGTAAKKLLSKRMLDQQQALLERGVRSSSHDD